MAREKAIRCVHLGCLHLETKHRPAERGLPAYCVSCKAKVAEHEMKDPRQAVLIP